jgi:hypothetical protein
MRRNDTTKFADSNVEPGDGRMKIWVSIRNYLTVLSAIDYLMAFGASLLFANSDFGPINILLRPVFPKDFLYNDQFRLDIVPLVFAVSIIILHQFRERTNRLQFRELSQRETSDLGTLQLEEEHWESGSVVTSPSRIERPLQKQELIAENLNKRVSALQARATMIYWTILITLAGGVTLIVFSGYLSQLDKPANEAWRRLGVENATSAISSNPTDRKLYEDHYAKLIDAEINNLKSDPNKDKIWNWPSTVLRISIAGLLVFLVQILIQLYRYNSLLIAFYSSRRDSLIMADGDVGAAKVWADLFAPANLDFGRQPRHPFQEVADLFRRRQPTSGPRETDEPLPSVTHPGAADATNALTRPPACRCRLGLRK